MSSTQCSHPPQTSPSPVCSFTASPKEMTRNLEAAGFLAALLKDSDIRGSDTTVPVTARH